MNDAILMLHSFAAALNPQLGIHMKTTARWARKVAQAYELADTDLKNIEMAAMIHEVGLLGLPKELQNKDIKLFSESQYKEYCEHPLTASIALECMDSLAAVGEIVLHHHEYMGGSGFPIGLSGDQIPLGSRILLVASDYSRVTTTWPKDMRKLVNYFRRYLEGDEYKRFTFSDNPETVIEECASKILLKDLEEKYDPEVVNTLIRTVNKAKNIDPAGMIQLEELKPGMTLLDDLRTEAGRLLLTRGTKLNDATIQTLQGIHSQGLIADKVYVSVPES